MKKGRLASAVVSLVIAIGAQFAVLSPTPANADSGGLYYICKVGSGQWTLQKGDRYAECTDGIKSGRIEAWYQGKFIEAFYWSTSQGLKPWPKNELSRLKYCIFGVVGGYVFVKTKGGSTVVKYLSGASTLDSLYYCVTGN